MELYDYSNLLKVVKEVRAATTTLENIKEIALKKKLEVLENRLLNDGILEDWVQLNKMYTVYYDGYKNECLKSISKNIKKAIEYNNDGELKVIMRSTLHSEDYLILNPEKSLIDKRIAYNIGHTTKTHYWDGFKSEEEEAITKIAMIEAIYATYEDYRSHILELIAKHHGDTIESNRQLLEEITNIFNEIDELS